MTGVGYDVVTVAANTSTGVQTITGSCGGRTPKAAVIFAGRGSTLGTAVNGAMFSAGITDGTNHRMLAFMSDNGQAFAVHDTGGQKANDQLVQTLTATDETVNGVADFDSFSANSLAIDWTDAPPVAYLLTVLLIYGDDLLATVVGLNSSTSVGGTATVSSLAFRPRALIGLGAIGGFAAAAVTHIRFSIGVAAFQDDGTIQQASTPLYELDTPSLLGTSCAAGIRTDAFLGRLEVDSSDAFTEEAWYELTAVSDTGFTLTTRNAALGITLGCIALYTANSRAWVGVPSLDTSSAGTHSITSPGWRPQALMALATGLATNNAHAKDATTLHWSLGVATASTQTCSGVTSDDNEATSDTRAVTSSKIAEILNDVGGIEWDATLAGFTATGFDVTIGTASASSRKVAFLAFEEDRKDHNWLGPHARAASQPRGVTPRHGFDLGGRAQGAGGAVSAATAARGQPGRATPRHGQALGGKTPQAPGQGQGFWKILTRFRLDRLRRMRWKPKEEEPEPPIGVPRIEQSPKGRVSGPGALRGRVSR